MTDFQELEQCRRDLAEGRVKARAAARDLEASMMQSIQIRTDQAVVRALANGATKTAVAAILGESRVTLNERLDRETGSHKAERVVEVYEQENPPYTIEDSVLKVDWQGYGPDQITAQNEMDIVKDEDSGSYWFMAIAGDPINEVNMKLDTVFTGWYYEDAAKFVAQSLEEE